MIASRNLLMGKHTFDADRARSLEEESRYAYLSVDELLALFDPGPAALVADLGSGTGFYTRPVAEQVGRVVGLDLQPRMHAAFGEFGVPDNVERVTAAVESLPLERDSLDAAYSTMTYHEFAGEQSLTELARVLAPGGRLAIADWSATGSGDRGPPLSERFDVRTIAADLETAGFTVDRVQDRRETLVVAARLPRPDNRKGLQGA